MNGEDPRQILRDADRLRSYSRGAESARHKIKMRGKVEWRKGVLRFFYSDSASATSFTDAELDALYLALARVRDEYERYAKDAESRVALSAEPSNR